MQTDLSSVGRAEDCSGLSNSTSLGRWFESGRSDFFNLPRKGEKEVLKQ